MILKNHWRNWELMKSVPILSHLNDLKMEGNSDLKFPEYRGQVLLNPCFQHVMILIWKFKGLPRQRG